MLYTSMWGTFVVYVVYVNDNLGDYVLYAEVGMLYANLRNSLV